MGNIPNLGANPNILICVDLASLCGTSAIQLRNYHNPDFVALSFYKIFGYPTGIGALLIRKTALAEKLKPEGFFGGSVDFYNPETGEFVLKENFEEKWGNFDTGFLTSNCKVGTPTITGKFPTVILVNF